MREIEVGEFIETVEYDYPTFHLSMDCFWCKIVKGDLVLLEAEASKWLVKDDLYSVEWLPADAGLIKKLEITGGPLMSLYALGDLHLSFQTNKPMDAFGRVWKHHERKIEKYVNQIVKPQDTLVLTGDHSWGRKLSECREDLAFIERLPGRKILLRGNHDMFWDAKKTERLNEEFQDGLFFLQNNFAVYEDYALVGTKGYTFEGPFYLDGRGRIMGWDEEREEQAKKLVDREMARLWESFQKAEQAGYRKFVMFLHYPPTNILEKTSPFTRIAEEYGVKAVVYSHCHGERRFGDSIRGSFHGVEYMLVSGDYLNFHPALVLP